MSVYSHGDKDRERDHKEETKKNDDLLKEAGKAIENVGKSLTSLFTSKDKRWEKKGGGHKLGSSSNAPPPPPRQATPQPEAPARAHLPPPPRAMTPAAEAAAAREAVLAKQRAGGARPTSAAARAAADRTTTQADGPHTRSSGGAAAGGASRSAGGGAAPALRVDEASVALCVEMGFDAASAREALSSKAGNVQAAIELLASGFHASQPTPPPATPPPPEAASPPLAGPAPVFVRVAVPEEMEARLAAAHEAAAALAADGASALPALALLKKLLVNILSAPEDPKFRRVRLSNPKIAAALGAGAAAHALLQLCGFELAAAAPGQADAPAEAVTMGDAAAFAAAALEECVALVSQAEEWAAQAEAGPSDIRVLYAPDGCGAARVHDMGEDFYKLTADDAKAMVAAAAARRGRVDVLQTRAQREADAARRRRRYRKASIRVRFADGTMLQATFAVSSPVSRIVGWVSDSLRQLGCEFELCPPRGRPLSDTSATIEAAELAPAAVLTFRPARPMEPPFLTQELLDQMAPLDAQAAALPTGEGGVSSDEPPHARAPVAEPRVPKWAPK